jgi:xylulokinase
VHKYTSPTSSSVDATPVREFTDKDDEALAILESQLLNYRSRSAAILRSDPGTLMPETPSSAPHLSRVYATGGASANATILSLMADVMACPVSKNVEFDPATGVWSDAHWNACSVGVAYKARWGWERATAKEAQRKWIGFDEFIGECREERKQQRGRVGKVDGLEEEGIRNVALPGEGSAAYDGIVERWRALEARALQEGKQSRS